MESSDILDDYNADFYFLDSKYDLELCYGNKDDREMVLWNTDETAEDFLEFLQQESDIDDNQVRVQFNNPNTYGGTDYVSEAESIMDDSLFGHIEHLSAFGAENNYNIQYFDSKEFKRSGYSASLVDSDNNAVALQAESLPENTIEIIEGLRPFNFSDNELERIDNELESRA